MRIPPCFTTILEPSKPSKRIKSRQKSRHCHIFGTDARYGFLPLKKQKNRVPSTDPDKAFLRHFNDYQSTPQLCWGETQKTQGMTKTLAHTTWECKYHIVWVPKNRRKVVYGTLQKDIGQPVVMIEPVKTSVVQRMLGHGTLDMIYHHYYSWIGSETRDDGSAFLKNTYFKVFTGSEPEAP